VPWPRSTARHVPSAAPPGKGSEWLCALVRLRPRRGRASPRAHGCGTRGEGSGGAGPLPPWREARPLLGPACLAERRVSASCRRVAISALARS